MSQVPVCIGILYLEFDQDWSAVHHVTTTPLSLSDLVVHINNED